MSAAPVLAYVTTGRSFSAAEDFRTRTQASQPQTSGLAFYRKHTEDLLRKYLRISMDIGRLPSLLNRGVLRGRATHCRIRNFEDAVVFVIDVERCLGKLDSSAQELVARITLQEYTYAEAAELTGQSLRSIARHYGEAVDRVTALLLDAELLKIEPWERCQAEDRPRNAISMRKY
ncbi:hypothetical protein [Silvibacterium dinghuense]|uniref:Uncharacterized protein n=1 Tax=Silvibacterium dinghuense TaxID=1560006 RepID=A0A4Q1SJC3_9BACT|nr:hypothetical protein [Silvibacterium dinghuense]RXS97744.1 hypothetical protein ESZ00_07730 [Silvibacterium dinghuense]GGH01648.1 hypothetical protein GCM10011586_16660 [Silvibacterium dinghuense]